MTPPAIRSGSVADADAVMRIMDGAFDPTFGEAWNRAQVVGMLSLGDVWLNLATLEGASTSEGFSLARRMADDSELLLLAVGPKARGCGIGRALVETVADEARARGATRLMLEMRDGNPALGLYVAAGFTRIGRRRAYYRGRDGAPHDALTLARPLGVIESARETALPSRAEDQ